MNETLGKSLDLSLSLLQATLEIPAKLPLVSNSIEDEQLINLLSNFVDSFGSIIAPLKTTKELIDVSTKESISNLYNHCLEAIEALSIDKSLPEAIQTKVKEVKKRLEDYGGRNLPEPPDFRLRPEQLGGGVLASVRPESWMDGDGNPFSSLAPVPPWKP